MGNSSTGPDLNTVCSCNCEDGYTAKYGDVYGGGTRAPEYSWQEEVCQLEGAQWAPREKGAPSAPSPKRGSRNREFVVPPHPASSTQRSAPSSPSKERRPSWRDLGSDGNYYLRFRFNSGSKFGLQLTETRDPQPFGSLVVASVDPLGVFADNVDNGPGLFAGDIIQQVNQVRGTAASLRDVLNQIATSSGDIDTVVQPRPATFDVFLKREGPNWKKLGLSVAIDRADTAPRMRVRTVRNEGLVPKWNETHGSMRVCVGDWITQVNGITKSAEEMYAMIQASSEGQILELRVETPSRDTPRQELDLENVDG